MTVPKQKLLRTFIVEDNPAIRDNLVATLEDLTPVVVVGTAPNEQSAVHMLTSGKLDVDMAIIDIFLSQGSGLGVLKALLDASVPVERVVLSNYATTEVRRHCLALGASQVFDKSGDIDALIDHCQALSLRAGRGPSPT